MILHRWGFQPRDDHNAPDIVQHAWAFEIDAWWRLATSGASIGVVHQVQRDDGTWSNGTHYYLICLTTYFAIGRNHAYYDGPHDSIDLGYLHITWSGDWCSECMPDDSCCGGFSKVPEPETSWLSDMIESVLAGALCNATGGSA